MKNFSFEYSRIVRNDGGDFIKIDAYETKFNWVNFQKCSRNYAVSKMALISRTALKR